MTQLSVFVELFTKNISSMCHVSSKRTIDNMYMTRKCMRGSRKFRQRRSTFDKVFLVDGSIEDPTIAINGLPSAR